MSFVWKVKSFYSTRKLVLLSCFKLKICDYVLVMYKTIFSNHLLNILHIFMVQKVFVKSAKLKRFAVLIPCLSYGYPQA